MAPIRTHAQKVAKVLVPKFTAGASVVGSSLILWDVISRHRKGEKLTTRHRLVAGMSGYDVLASLAWFLTSWPVPKGVPGILWNVGNEATCTAQGFVTQFAIGTVVYNACLALYYLLVLRYKWSMTYVSQRVEPWMHGTAAAVTLFTSVTPLFLGLYNPSTWDCWIMPYPMNCTQSYRLIGSDETTDCLRGDNARIYQIIFSYGPTYFIMMFLVLSMILVFLKVRSVERASAAHAVAPGRLQWRTAIQGLLYVSAMLFTWGIMIGAQIKWEVSGGQHASWLVYFFGSSMLPAQGLFNSLIYFCSPMLARNTERSDGFVAQSFRSQWMGVSRSFALFSSARENPQRKVSPSGEEKAKSKDEQLDPVVEVDELDISKPDCNGDDVENGTTSQS